jgi:hypothetical protein
VSATTRSESLSSPPAGRGRENKGSGCGTQRPPREAECACSGCCTPHEETLVRVASQGEIAQARAVARTLRVTGAIGIIMKTITRLGLLPT